MKSGKRILVVSDRKALSWELYNQLGRTGAYQIMVERKGSKAYDTAQQIQPDMIVVDFETPGLEQSWLTAQLQTSDPFFKVPVMVLTGTLAQDEREIAMDMLGHPFLSNQTGTAALTERIQTRLAH